MTQFVRDTVVAIASAPGGAARGIVRVSGPQAVEILARCFQVHSPMPPELGADPGQDLYHWAAVQEATQARVWPGWLDIGQPFGQVECMLYLWPGARSYTREPCAELHMPGSPPLLEAAVHRLCRAGARLAEPGEFTLRAFQAGRIDLIQAEAVLGVIDAGDERALRVALRQLAGGLTRPLHSLRDALIELLALLEAGLDFADEEIEFLSTGELVAGLTRVLDDLCRLNDQMERRSSHRHLHRLVLRGEPNVGKSSLFNALVGSNVAIVSDQRGTTRDYLTAPIEIAGIRVELIDTAGIDADACWEVIAKSAQDASCLQMESADGEILCLDGTRGVTDRERRWLLEPSPAPRLVVWTKADATAFDPDRTDARRGIPLSAVTGVGLERLRAEIGRLFQDDGRGSHDVIPATSARCLASIHEAIECLTSALALTTGAMKVTEANPTAAWTTSIGIPAPGEEVVAVELRAALDAIGRMVGAVHADDILGQIFSKFCIGK